MYVIKDEASAARLTNLKRKDKDVFVVEYRDMKEHPCDESDLQNESPYWIPLYVTKRYYIAEKLAKSLLSNDEDIKDNSDKTIIGQKDYQDGNIAVSWEGYAYEFKGKKSDLLDEFDKYHDLGKGFYYKLVKIPSGYAVINIVKVLGITVDDTDLRYILYVGDLSVDKRKKNLDLDFSDRIQSCGVYKSYKKAKKAAKEVVNCISEAIGE